MILASNNVLSNISYQAANASAKEQMAFQERMSNTAHQREVADLKAAGLNPVLSAGGTGASTPTGAEGYVGDSNAKKFDESAAMYEMMMKSLDTNAKAISAVSKASGRSFRGNGDSGSSGDLFNDLLSIVKDNTNWRGEVNWTKVGLDVVQKYGSSIGSSLLSNLSGSSSSKSLSSNSDKSDNHDVYHQVQYGASTPFGVYRTSNSVKVGKTTTSKQRFNYFTKILKDKLKD